MTTFDLDRYYAWQLEELRRREAMMGCMLPDLIDASRLPKARAALRRMLGRTEEQLARLGALIRRNRPGGGRWTEQEQPDPDGGHDFEGGAPTSMRELTSLVTAREMAVLASCGYGWAQLLAERLQRPDEGRLLRLSLEEKTDAKVDLMRLAADLLSRQRIPRPARHRI